MELQDRDSLIIHIEGLQATLTKRNARIAELEAQITREGKKMQSEMAVRKAYKKGWTDCAAKLAEITRQTALQLSEVKREAWRAYTEGQTK